MIYELWTNAKPWSPPMKAPTSQRIYELWTNRAWRMSVCEADSFEEAERKFDEEFPNRTMGIIYLAGSIGAPRVGDFKFDEKEAELLAKFVDDQRRKT